MTKFAKRHAQYARIVQHSILVVKREWLVGVFRSGKEAKSNTSLSTQYLSKGEAILVLDPYSMSLTYRGVVEQWGVRCLLPNGRIMYLRPGQIIEACIR